jgi:hypothetical protein
MRNVFTYVRLYGEDTYYEPNGLPPATLARPGSLEKLLVLSDRLERGLAMHHPDDEKVLATQEQEYEAKSYVADESRRSSRKDYVRKMQEKFGT